ncbi:MAG: tetratricopeptide repeat protein [Chitinophagales bacterium]
MKYLLILIICIIAFAHCEAQYTYMPDPKAKMVNDKAINTYIRYNKNQDSVVSVIRMLDQALNIDSNYFIAWTNKLSFECQLKQYDNALNTAKRIIRIFPDQTNVIFFSGLLEFKTGHNDEATATFNKLINIYDEVPDTNNNSDHLKTALLNKGIALKLMGKADESRKIFVNLSIKESDLAVRRHINAYISKSKEEIINKLLNESIAQ